MPGGANDETLVRRQLAVEAPGDVGLLHFRLAGEHAARPDFDLPAIGQGNLDVAFHHQFVARRDLALEADILADDESVLFNGIRHGFSFVRGRFDLGPPGRAGIVRRPLGDVGMEARPSGRARQGLRTPGGGSLGRRRLGIPESLVVGGPLRSVLVQVAFLTKHRYCLPSLIILPVFHLIGTPAPGAFEICDPVSRQPSSR